MGIKREDLIGKKFNKLTVIEYVGKAKWLCKCDCGEKTVVYGKHLKNNNTKSCGCIRKIDLIGKKFNRLTPIKYIKDKNRWLCKCDCGNKVLVFSSDLRRNSTKSCGCLKTEVNKSRTGKNGPMYGLYGPLNPNYKHELTDEERADHRNHYEYPLWRKFIYERDNYTCQLCGDNKGGNLVAHHLNSFKDFKEDRYNLYNGITLCTKCHKAYHKKYGRNHSTFNKFAEYYKECKEI